MAKLEDLGRTWLEVISNWGGGVAPPVQEAVGWPALLNLERLWPEQFEEVINIGGKGPWLIADLVDNGLTLSTCENLKGFANVIRRLREGDHGALSELRFAVALHKAGYVAELEPKLLEKRLDASIQVDDRTVYVEVICPQLTPPMKEAEKGLGILAQALTQLIPRLITDVHMIESPNEEAINQVLRFVASSKLLEANVTYEIGKIALLRCRPFIAKDLFDKTNYIDRSLPAIGIVSSKRNGAHPSLAMVRLRLTDERAARLMQAESHHFSKGEINILAIDVSNLPGTMNRWRELLLRRFQPKVNKRFGAIVLFNRINQLSTAKIVRCCLVLKNQYAYQEVPKSIVAKMASLDECELLKKLKSEASG